MASYSVSALPLDQSGPSSRFMLAVSVFDSNGSGVSNLGESNFAVHNLTSETQFSIAEVQSAGPQGFYRLFLRAVPDVYAGEWVLALIVTGHRHVAGRIPGNLDDGNVMVKVKV
jgi:hypothetical protein